MDIENKLMYKFHFKLYIFFIAFGFLFYACDDNPQQFKLGEEFIESETQLNVIDTFSVKLSTIIYDSVVTSGTENIIVGNYRDNVFGKIKSNSYFQVGIPDSLEVDEHEVYDSLCLVLTYNDYFYGDTTRDQKISVYQLTEKIDLNDEFNITGQTTFNYNKIPLGSLVYAPKPKSSADTLKIKLKDAIGIDLFSKLEDESDIYDNNDNFINYFYGLVLVASDAYEGSIIGFKTNPDAAKLVLYTTRGDVSTETMHYEFKLEAYTRQFNNITYDFSGTQLNNLTQQKDELPSKDSGGLSFLHGGIGLALRVDFPSFREFLFRERGSIVEAELSIVPKQGTYNEFNLPTGLVMYESGKNNQNGDLIVDNRGLIASSKLTIDNMYHETTAYTFDVTKFLNDEIADSYVDPENGLIISLSTTPLSSKLSRLVADANDKNTRLKIYYLSY